MSVKPKHGKGKYAYQAKVASKKQAVILQADTSGNTVAAEIKPEIKTTGNLNIAAAIPASIGKVDLAFEMKQICIIAAAILVLLVLLSIVLK